MISARELVDRVADFLAGRIPLESLEDSSASFVHSMYRDGSPEAISIGQRIGSILNAFQDDESDEGMRAELANAILPFESAEANLRLHAAYSFSGDAVFNFSRNLAAPVLTLIRKDSLSETEPLSERAEGPDRRHTPPSSTPHFVPLLSL